MDGLSNKIYKNSVKFVTEMEGEIIKFLWQHKKTSDSANNLEEKAHAGDTVPDFTVLQTHFNKGSTVLVQKQVQGKKTA